MSILGQPEIEAAISGEQRLRNIRTKMRLIADREMRAFQRGEIATCGMWDDRERALIIRELDRVFALGVAAGRILPVKGAGSARGDA